MSSDRSPPNGSRRPDRFAVASKKVCGRRGNSEGSIGAGDGEGAPDVQEREVLRFIAREEPLAATLQRFPGISRHQVEVMLERLAGKASAPSPSPQARPAASQAEELWLFTDGASRGNPGLAGAGAILLRGDGTVVAKRAVFLGTRTNNEAEYEALLIGLALAREYSPLRLQVRLDSELLVRQLNGQYRVRHPGLIPLHRKARELLRSFPNCSVVHVMREQNTLADELSNRAIDERP